MRELKFRYICKDVLGRTFTFAKTIEEMERAELNINTYGRIQEIISRDQYTGLKDKNGKEIYEGDIIKDIENWIGIVEWNKKDCFFNINYPIQNETMMFDDAFDSNPEKNTEIIGNIYENPKLMEADQ